MRSSLLAQLVGAFLVIILVGALAIYATVNVVTTTQFRRFVLAEDIAQAQALTEPLADFFRRQQSWRGVDELLAFSVVPPGSMGPSMMRGIGGMMSRSGEEMMALMQARMSTPDRVVLLDAGGTVVADTAGTMVGQRHADDHLAQGAAVQVGGQQIGTVLVGSMIEPALNPLAEDFLRSINLSVLLLALLGGLGALALGLILFRQIMAPLRQVTAGAEAVAAGDLNRRVEEQGPEELSRLARAFNHMAASLAEAEQLRHYLIADVAHELRTPIFVMQANLEAMLDGVFDLNQENVAEVHQETLLLGRLVGDLRDLASAEAGELRLQLEPCDLNQVVRRGIDQMQAEAKEKDLTLTAVLAPDLPAVLADSQRIEQVLYNLVTNALRHTPRGGWVQVQSSVLNDLSSVIGDSHTPMVDQDRLSGDRWAVIAVRDSGEGILAEDLPYVFERFYRADRSRSRATGGSGLGLTIARQIVLAHGGQIWAESAGPAQGSAFALALPLAVVSSAPERASPSLTNSSRSPFRDHSDADLAASSGQTLPEP